jgi:hypothetical protein
MVRVDGPKAVLFRVERLEDRCVLAVPSWPLADTAALARLLRATFDALPMPKKRKA